MVEKFENWDDYELGMIAKAIMDCRKCKSCAECPCDGILCSIDNVKETRENFVNEFVRRVME